MYLNEILPGKWREDEWPEHIEVSHEASRFKSHWSTDRATGVAWPNVMTARPPSPWPMPCRTSCEPVS